MRTKTSFILGNIALALTLFSTPAVAKDFQLRYSPTELSTTAGAEAVYFRISDLAKDICDDEFGRYATRNRAQKERCLRQTVRDLVVKVSDTKLDQVSAENAKFRRNDNHIYLAKRD